MEIGIIQDRLSQYNCVTALDEENALKEITQEIALLALSRQGFFQVAEFVAKFLKPIEQNALKIWGKDFFHSRLEKLKDYLI